MQALLPAPLLRSLRRFGDCHEDVNATDVSQSSFLHHGVLLGTQKLVKTSKDDVHQIAIWALLHQPSDDCTGQSFDRNLPGGISRIGSFVVVRGDAVADDKKIGITLIIDHRRRVWILDAYFLLYLVCYA